MSIPNFEIYTSLIESIPAAERKGKTMPYTSLNGHMYSFLDKDGFIGLRLSPSDIDTFIETFGAQLMVQHGRTMKAFVRIPIDLLDKGHILEDYFAKSYTHTAGLKPKPTKKSK